MANAGAATNRARRTRRTAARSSCGAMANNAS
uniref:Uncharacterized protein n=1 Tax=Arundo donax TaxID=35708 RepID=A0A0A9GR99_ARUDO